MNDKLNLTPRQLREILFHLDNQDMTVRELRQALYNVEPQDAPMPEGFAMWKKLGVEAATRVANVYSDDGRVFMVYDTDDLPVDWKPFDSVQAAVTWALTLGYETVNTGDN